MFARSFLLTALLVGLIGCSQSKQNEPRRATRMPDLPSGQSIEPGVLLSKVSIDTTDGSKRLWVYLPQNQTGKVPLVVIAPAGSPMFHGTTLGEGSMPEHLPYVRSGFAVLAYEIDGPLEDNASDNDTIKAAQEFRDANAGVANAKLALDYAVAKLPIDPAKIYSAGHSSAGTISLQVAQHDSRIAGCIVYAPVADVAKRLGHETLAALDTFMPGYSKFLEEMSPVTQIDKLKCPVFLFHAKDDSNVPFADSEAFAAQLSSKNPHTKFEVTPTGDHYESMIEVGIPKAIEWLKEQTGRR